MTHEQFVKACRAGEVSVRVSPALGPAVWESAGSQPRKMPGRRFWWVWSLVAPAALFASAMWGPWWVFCTIAAAALMTTLVLAHRTRRSTEEFLRKQALEDEEFYKLAVQSGVLEIKERGR